MGRVNLLAMTRRIAPLLLLCVLVWDCGERESTTPPHVTLRIEDPRQIAAELGQQVTQLVLTDASGNSTELDPSTFPVRVTLTSKRAGPQLVTVDAFGPPTDSVEPPTIAVRGQVTIDIDADNGKEVPLTLGLVCGGGTDACPPLAPSYAPCTSDAACDDGVFCNGQGRCIDGECHVEAVTCAYTADGCQVSICIESQETCYTVPSGLEGCDSQACLPDGEIQPDGTPCDDASCYAGVCGGSPLPCRGDLVDFADIPDGTTLWGPGNELTFLGLRFPESDPSGYGVTWQVVGSARELVPDADANGIFTFSVDEPRQLASLRIRTGHGGRCAVSFSPSLEQPVQYVRETEYATLTFRDGSFVSNEEQRVRMTVACEAQTPRTLRIEDICLVNRGPR